MNSKPLKIKSVIRYLEYAYPHQGFANINDEFMLGDSILVAPVLTKNTNKRNIELPEGNWEYLDGEMYKGPTVIEVLAPLDVLPYFIKK